MEYTKIKAEISDISSVEKQGEELHHTQQENALNRTKRHISITDWMMAINNLKATYHVLFAMAKSV